MKLLIRRVEHKAGNGRYFKTVDSAFSEDDRLSGTACKLLLNMLCKPDMDWDLSYPYFQHVFKEKLTIIKRASRELRVRGDILK